MRFVPLALAGSYAIEPDPEPDVRGSFTRTYDVEAFRAQGIPLSIVQGSTSHNRVAGTFRGLHHQAAPAAEVKLVRCRRGAIFDVLVDLRPESPSYRAVVTAELSAANGTTLYVPAGVAHGFLTLEDDSEVDYLMDAPYRPDLARGVRWDDPILDIEWPRPVEVISERDLAFPDLTT